ncbi:hypothetical protein [Coxiella-like endosymbiont]|uniref:hypothetical protein n=1 Tax=Coxiella-like endosymbiont TaxID=1592897 RepID=UPI00272C6577|nr:hypothetical protein [Coxiella-like endosymbiont]
MVLSMAMTRLALQDEIIHLNQQLGKTIIFVTHDIFQVFRIADRIAVWNIWTGVHGEPL